MMASLGVVDGKVPVVTMVHDCQVLDLKDDLFGSHDLPVDYIVTPTRVIECNGNLPKPKGIIWSMLTQDRLNHIPVLRRIRFREWKAGNNVALDGETENPVELSDMILENDEGDEKVGGYRGNFQRRERRRKQPEEGGNAGEDNGKDKERSDDAQKNKNNRRFNRRRQFRSYKNKRFNRKTSENDGDNREDGEERPRRIREDGDEQNREGGRNNSESGRDGSGGNRGGGGARGGGNRWPGPNRRRPLYEIEGSVYVGSLPRSLRVSQFKVKVRERKVTPLRVLWRGSSGFAFLNFRTQQDAEEALVALEGLQISDRALKLEMARSGSDRVRRPRGARLSNQRNSQSEGEAAAEEEEERAD